MATPGKVGVVFVSHSARIAEGLVELARQMAPSAALVAAGGTDDGRIGTSFDLVSSGIAEADSGAGVVVLCDLGSAILTTETALDFLDDEMRERVRIVDAPLVEADGTRRLDDGGPGIVRQRHAVGQPLGARADLGFARHEDLAARRRRLRALHERHIPGDIARKEALGIEHLGVDVEGQHAVGEAPALGIGRARARERAAQDLA